jgi:PiT family inorganic phosphate transporter
VFFIGVLWMAQGITPRTGRKVFGTLQVISSSLMAWSHGQNDAQKVMGVITMALIAGGHLPKDAPIPLWVIIACGGAMGLGTAIGGWKVIRTLGMKLARITPVEGFVAETAASGVLTAAAVMGVPVSTTHTITGSIMGVGSVLRFKTVQWGLGAKIVYAWLLTLPVCFAMGFVISWIGK